MVAEAIVREVAPLACNDRLRLVRGDQVATVKAGCWDCPSCGRDKLRSLVAMVAAAGAQDLLTVTLEQPRAVLRGREVTPPGFELCDRFTHVRTVRDRWGKVSPRWLTLAGCDRCCRRVSRMVDVFVKSVRRRWPAFGYLRVIEDHKSGALHLHWAVTGLDGDHDQVAGELLGLWRSAGGGRQVDLSSTPEGSAPGRVGWYLGKYLAKRQEQRMARGFRRWSRSRGFAPDVLMAWSQAWRRQWAEQRQAERPAPVVVDVQVPDRVHRWERVGWVHPGISMIITRVRLWPEST